MGMCLGIRQTDMWSGGVRNGDLVQLWECNPDMGTQNWMWEDDGTIRSALNDGMCIDAPGEPDSMRDLWMWECNGGGGQYFSYGENPWDPTMGGALIYAQTPWDQGNGHCVDIRNGGDAGGGNGGTLLLFPCSKDAYDGEPWRKPKSSKSSEVVWQGLAHFLSLPQTSFPIP